MRLVCLLLKDSAGQGKTLVPPFSEQDAVVGLFLRRSLGGRGLLCLFPLYLSAADMGFYSSSRVALLAADSLSDPAQREEKNTRFLLSEGILRKNAKRGKRWIEKIPEVF